MFSKVSRAVLIMLLVMCFAYSAAGETTNVNEMHVTLSEDDGKPVRMLFTAVSMENVSSTFRTTKMVFEASGRTGAVEHRITIELPGNWEPGNVYTQEDQFNQLYGYCSIIYEDLQAGKTFWMQSNIINCKIAYTLSILHANANFTMCAGTFQGECTLPTSSYDELLMRWNYFEGGKIVLIGGTFYADMERLREPRQTQAPEPTATPHFNIITDPTQAPEPTTTPFFNIVTEP